ncbi:MAG: glycosyltransferase, partial [Verrucomicrobiota bacterium]
MNPLPKFTVVLANYNGAEFLGEAIESVLMQTLRDFEFIVYDDGSTDDSLKVAESFVARSAGRLRIISAKENKGQATGFNVGIAEARGDWIAFLDSDDLWYPDKLATVYEGIRGRKGWSIHMHYLNPLLNGEIDHTSTIPVTLTAGDVYAQALESCQIPRFVSTSGLCFSKEVLLRVGGVPEGFITCADGYLTRTSMCFGRVLVTDQTLGAYRQHSSNNVFGNSRFRGHQYLRDLLVPQLHQFYKKNNLRLRYAHDEFTSNGAFVETLGLFPGDRVVIVRSAPPGEMKLVLDHLKNAQIEIELWVQEGLENDYVSWTNSIETIRGGGFSLQTLSERLVEKTKSNVPKHILVVYLSENMHEHYHNIHACLSQHAFGCPVVGIEPRYGNMYSVNQIGMRQKAQEDPRLLQGPSDAPWTSEHFQKNSERLASLKDKYAGRRGFIIGTGPSLKIEDLEHLKDEITFACNKIFLAYSETEWRPTVYSICDEMVAQNIKEQVCDLKALKILAHSVRKYLWEDPGAVFVNPHKSAENNRSEVGWDLVRGANAGHTVLNLHIKIAYWMGIRELYIIGADHSFQVPDTKTGERLMNNDVIVGEGEINHFHKDYRPSGEKWTMPQYANMERDFAESKRIFEQAGGRIYNASRKTKLDVFERIDLDEVLSETNLKP